MTIAPIVLLQAFLAFGGCFFAFWKGGRAERISAGLIVGNLLLLALADAASPNASSGVVGLVIDGLTAVALLTLVLVYTSPWLGAVMLLFALKFGLLAFYFVMERPADVPHAVINNADFMAIIACLVIGTISAWRKRARASAPVFPEGVAGESGV